MMADNGGVQMTRDEIEAKAEVADCEAGDLGYTYDPHASPERWTVWAVPNGRHCAVAREETPESGWEIRDDGAAEGRVAELCKNLDDLDDGTGTLGIVVRQALEDDPRATEEDVRQIVCEAIEDAAAERAADEED